MHPSGMTIVDCTNEQTTSPTLHMLSVMQIFDCWKGCFRILAAYRMLDLMPISAKFVMSLSSVQQNKNNNGKNKIYNF